MRQAPHLYLQQSQHQSQQRESLYKDFKGIESLHSSFDPNDPTEVNQVRVEMNVSLDDDGANFDTWDGSSKQPVKRRESGSLLLFSTIFLRTKADSAAKHLITSKVTKVISRMIAGMPVSAIPHTWPSGLCMWEG
jgi:hypothetical protein